MRKFIVIKTEDKYKKIYLSDILFCRADGAYTRFYLKSEETFITSKLLKNVEEELIEDAAFYRINRQYLVNLDHCQEILTKGSYKLVLSDGTKLPISRSRYKELIEQFCAHL